MNAEGFFQVMYISLVAPLYVDNISLNLVWIEGDSIVFCATLKSLLSASLPSSETPWSILM